MMEDRFLHMPRIWTTDDPAVAKWIQDALILCGEETTSSCTDGLWRIQKVTGEPLTNRSLGYLLNRLLRAVVENA